MVLVVGSADSAHSTCGPKALRITPPIASEVAWDLFDVSNIYLKKPQRNATAIMLATGDYRQVIETLLEVVVSFGHRLSDDLDDRLTRWSSTYDDHPYTQPYKLESPGQ